MPDKKEQEETKPEEPQRWIYRSTGPDHTLVLRKSTSERRVDPSGIVHERHVPPIKVKFLGGRLMLDEAMAKHLGVELPYLVKLMEESHENGSGFRLIYAPDKTPTEDELKWEAQSQAIADGKETAVTQGPRATGGRAK